MIYIYIKDRYNNYLDPISTSLEIERRGFDVKKVIVVFTRNLIC